MEYMESKMQDLHDAQEHEFNELYERLKPPYDWENPQWNIEDRIHNWRNYASEELKAEWRRFSGQQKMIIASALDKISENEEWD